MDASGAGAGAGGAPVIKFRNYQPRDQSLVGGGGGGGKAPSSAAAPPRPAIGVALAPLPAPSVLLAQADAAQSAAILASAKSVRGDTAGLPRARVVGRRGASGGPRAAARASLRVPLHARAPSARVCGVHAWPTLTRTPSPARTPPRVCRSTASSSRPRSPTGT